MHARRKRQQQQWRQWMMNEISGCQSISECKLNFNVDFLDRKCFVRMWILVAQRWVNIKFKRYLNVTVNYVAKTLWSWLVKTTTKFKERRLCSQSEDWDANIRAYGTKINATKKKMRRKRRIKRNKNESLSNVADGSNPKCRNDRPHAYINGLVWCHIYELNMMGVQNLKTKKKKKKKNQPTNDWLIKQGLYSSTVMHHRIGRM